MVKDLRVLPGYFFCQASGDSPLLHTRSSHAGVVAGIFGCWETRRIPVTAGSSFAIPLHPVSNPTPGGICPIKLVLLKGCAISARAHASNVTGLHKVVLHGASGVYTRFLQAAENSRVRSEKARLEYERHVAEHGC